MSTVAAGDVDAAELQMYMDEQAVRNVHLRYLKAIDRHDWELVKSCFHPGATENHGMFNGTAEGFIEFAKEFVDAVEIGIHVGGNQLVEVDGDTAWHEGSCVYYERSKPTDGEPAFDRTVVCRYIDKMERREGRWGVVDRVLVVDAERQHPVHPSELPVPTWHYGRNDPSDASYNREVPFSEFMAGR